MAQNLTDTEYKKTKNKIKNGTFFFSSYTLTLFLWNKI